MTGPGEKLECMVGKREKGEEGKMRVIGLTGGIATGKSTVSRMLAEKGLPIVDADLIAREVVEPGKPAYREIVQTFGGGNFTGRWHP